MQALHIKQSADLDAADIQIAAHVYIRKVEMRDAHYWNVEFDKIENVRDPGA